MKNAKVALNPEVSQLLKKYKLNKKYTAFCNLSPMKKEVHMIKQMNAYFESCLQVFNGHMYRYEQKEMEMELISKSIFLILYVCKKPQKFLEFVASDLNMILFESGDPFQAAIALTKFRKQKECVKMIGDCLSTIAINVFPSESKTLTNVKKAAELFAKLPKNLNDVRIITKALEIVDNMDKITIAQFCTSVLIELKEKSYEKAMDIINNPLGKK